jgi:hypothetical protein
MASDRRGDRGGSDGFSPAELSELCEVLRKWLIVLEARMNISASEQEPGRRTEDLPHRSKPEGPHE